MKLVLRNTSLEFQTNDVEVSQEIRTLLTNAYGNVSEANMKAFQVFADSIGWGESNSIYSKLDVLIIPFLLNPSDYSSLSKVFWNLKTGAYEQFGANGSQSAMTSSLSTYINVSNKGIIPLKITGAYSGFYNFHNTISIKNYCPFVIYENLQTITNDAGIMPLGNNKSGGTPYGLRYAGNIENKDAKCAACDGTNYKFSSNYQSLKTDGVFVEGNNKAFGKTTEITATVNDLDAEVMLLYPNFGGMNVDTNASNNSEKTYFKLFGFCHGLSDTEAETLRDALVVLKSKIGM